MMDAYLDTGALVPLFTNEVFSEAITAYMERRGQATAISAFHRLELENAFQLKRFRGEISDDKCLAALRKVEAYATSGMLVPRPVNWIAAFEKARQIGTGVTATTGCRTLDLIHVAIAIQWDCSRFVSADERQLAAARRKGLKVVDLRALHSRGRPGPQGPPAVKERSAACRAGKQQRSR